MIDNPGPEKVEREDNICRPLHEQRGQEAGSPKSAQETQRECRLGLLAKEQHLCTTGGVARTKGYRKTPFYL